MSAFCARLHQLFNARECWRFPFDDGVLPINGVYVLFEDGERAHEGRRIVRVGIHRGDDRLGARLREHFITPNKDRSIFRKNIGRALLAKRGDPFLKHWDLDLTTSVSRAKYAHTIDFEKQRQVEQEVTQYIRRMFSVAAFEVRERLDREDWEALLVGTVASCADCRASADWLGNHSPKLRIRESGLWQEQKLNSKPFDEERWRAFDAILK